VLSTNGFPASGQTNISRQGNTNCYFGNVGQSSADDFPLPDPSLNGYKILTQNFSLLTHPDIPNCLIWMFLVPPEFLFVKPHMITIFCHELNPTRLLVKSDKSVKSHIFCRSCKLSVSMVKSCQIPTMLGQTLMFLGYSPPVKTAIQSSFLWFLNPQFLKPVDA
jgi:hypothetical protein